MSTERKSRLIAWTCAIFAVVLGGTFVSDVWLEINYQLAADVSLLFAAAGVNAFTLLYLFRSRWRSNRIGRIYLVKCLALSVFLDQASLSVWWDDDYPYRQQIRFAIYMGTALVYLLPMLVSLWREQQRDREDEPDLPPPVDA